MPLLNGYLTPRLLVGRWVDAPVKFNWFWAYHPCRNGSMHLQQVQSSTCLGATPLLPLEQTSGQSFIRPSLMYDLPFNSIISLNTIYWYKAKYVHIIRDDSRLLIIFQVSGSLTATISSNVSLVLKLPQFAHNPDHRPDPNGILTFAAQQLQAAEDAGQRAWIMAHMPPSTSDALHDQVRGSL